MDEVGYDKANPERILVRIDPKYFRPTEVPLLVSTPHSYHARVHVAAPTPPCSRRRANAATRRAYCRAHATALTNAAFTQPRAHTPSC